MYSPDFFARNLKVVVAEAQVVKAKQELANAERDLETARTWR